MNNLYQLLVFGQYNLLIVLLAVGLTPLCAFGQSVEGRLGDASINPTSPSRREPYGMNSPVESIGTSSFTTRHYRSGNDGGIGSSFLGTTSATVESRPVSKYSPPAQITSPAVSSFNKGNRPYSFSQRMLYSPALSRAAQSLTLYSEPASLTAIGQNSMSAQIGKSDSLPYNFFWGHKKIQASFQPSINTLNGTEYLSK